MEKKEYAVELKHNGCNCAQAVLCAFAEESGFPAETLKQIGAAFGGGMGCMEGTCGALCGAEMLLGLARYNGKPLGRDAAALHKAFANACGATLCKDLKGRDTGVVLCACDDCVRNAASLVEETIFLNR